MAALRSSCEIMLATFDKRWSQFGLDGINIDGVFDSSVSKPQEFSLWSPRAGSVPHMMLAAAFDCFPLEDCKGIAGELLEIARSYFDLQPPITVIGHNPIRLRLAPWVHAKDASEIERKLQTLSDGDDLFIDVSGMEHCGALTRILPVENLLKRTGTVRWKVQSDLLDALITVGVAPSMIEVVHSVPISRTGEPIVLGGIFISSSELISLAKAGKKIELVRALREEFPLTIAQASQAAAELIEIVALVPACDQRSS